MLYLIELDMENSSAPCNILQEAKEYIDRNWFKDIKISELAAISHLSDTHFRRKWKEQYGCTSIEYRDGLRLSHACDFLASNYYNVGEVAEKCGFEDVSYFIRFFKKKKGVSPGAYIGRGER